MKSSTIRSLIPIIIALLAGLWYGGLWVYTAWYVEPRNEQHQRIDEAKKQIEVGTQNLALMRQTVASNQQLYLRSLPQQPSAARSLYQYWLLELLKYSEMTQPAVDSAPQVNLRYAYQYRFQLRGRGSLDQVTLLLYQFYWAPFLQHITAMSITPVENSELVDLALTIDVLALPPAKAGDPYPSLDKLPAGYYKRLASNPLSAYRSITERNLMQHARGGIDKADFTFLTSIQRIDGEPIIWLTDRTTDRIIKVKIGERVDIGSFRGTLLAVEGRDIVLQRSGMLWLLSSGESLQEAYALPPEVKPLPH